MTKKCKGCGTKFYTNNNLKDRCKKCERTKLREQIELSTFAATLDNEIDEHYGTMPYPPTKGKKRMKKMKGYKKLGEANEEEPLSSAHRGAKSTQLKDAKVAKKLFKELIDPDGIIEGGLHNLDDNLDEYGVLPQQAKAIKKIIMSYIKKVKECINSL